MKYDYIVVGGGPTGMVTSYILSKSNYKVLLVEHSNSIGGCWKTDWIDSTYFSEHSPKVIDAYSYPLFFQYLREIQVPMDTYPAYRNGMLKMVSFFLQHTSLTDLKHILFAIGSNVLGVLNFDYNQSVSQWMKSKRLTPTCQRMLTILCIALANTPDKLSIGVLMDALSFHPIANLVQLQRPSEWIDKTAKHLEKNDVTIKTNIHIKEIDNETMRVTTTTGEVFTGNKIVLCVPIRELFRIVHNSPNAMQTNWFSNMNTFERYVNQSSYIGIGIQLHFDDTISTSSKGWCWSCTKEWTIIVTDKTKLLSKNTSVKTVWSCAIVDLDSPSSRIQKTPRQCSMEELKQEVVHQLSTAFGKRLTPARITVHAGVHKKEGVWETVHSGFSNILGTLPQKGRIDNVYTVGPHTMGGIATLETAIESAVEFCTSQKCKYRFNTSRTYWRYVVYVLIVIAMFLEIRKWVAWSRKLP